MATFKPFLLLISFLALALVSSSIRLPGGLSKGNFATCELRFYVKTLSDQCAGTTSNVSIDLSFSRFGPGRIRNLVEWNLLPPPPGGYFQPGHLDTFSGTTFCNYFGMLCSLNITITGTGHSPTWGLEYIEVVTFEGNQTVQFNDWLTPENNYNVNQSELCLGFSKGMPGSTKGSLAI